MGWKRWKRASAWTVASIVALLVALRIAAPYVLERYVNRTLDELEGYEGHVGDIDLALWRGAYRLEDVEIVKVQDAETMKGEGEAPMPLFSAPRIDMSVRWGALLKGAVVAAIAVHQPEINVVAEPPAAEGEKKAEAKAIASNWQKQVKALTPLRIDHVAVHDGEVHFRNPHTQPNVDVVVDEINGRLSNLTNSTKVSESLVARAEFTGVAMGSGRVKLDASADPLRARPTFDLDAQIEGLELTALNDILRAYANLDAEAGTMSAYTEITSRDGRFRGYVKPMISDARLLDWKQEEGGFLGKLWEATAEGAKQLLESEETGRVATRVPLRGQIESPDADIWTTVVYVLRNAFVQALNRGLEGSLGRR